MKKIFYMIIGLLSYMSMPKAQETEEAMTIAVGQSFPEFTFEDIQHFSKPVFSRNDLLGKYTILDFWATNCMSCLRSFPKLNAIQKEYKGRLNLIPVGFKDQKGLVYQVYDKMKKGYNLDLTVAFDSVNFRRFCAVGLPYLMWINPKGTIIAITEGDALTEKNINNFIQDKPFSFFDSSYQANVHRQESFDWAKLLLVDGNGGSDTSFMKRSIIKAWTPEAGGFTAPASPVLSKLNPGSAISMLQLNKVNLAYLYTFAFWDKRKQNGIDQYGRPIFNVPDTSVFFGDSGIGKDVYCYSLAIRGEIDSQKVREMMKSDLRDYFGYDAKLERRMMPCFVLKVSDPEKAKLLMEPLKGKKGSWKKGVGGVIIERTPAQVASKLISDAMPAYARPNVYDETGIEGLISLEMHYLSTDFNSLQESVKKYGLIFERSKREMEVFVIFPVT